MKKLFWILFVVLLISGCAPAPQTLAPGAESEKQPIRLARIGGALYYDTGEENHKITCGTMDGILKKGAEPFSVPMENGTVNFDGARGYQPWTEDTKSVQTSDGFYIFKKIDTYRDISRYTKAYAVSGTLPNAHAQSTLIVLATDEAVTFEKAAEAYLSATWDESVDPYVFPLLSYEKPFGVTYSVSNVTPSGLTLTITQSGGTVTGTLQTGLDYTLERLHPDGWKSVEYIAEPIFPMLAKSIGRDSSQDMQINWKYHCGALPKGQYRLTKDIWDYRGPANFDRADISIPFEIQ